MSGNQGVARVAAAVVLGGALLGAAWSVLALSEKFPDPDVASLDELHAAYGPRFFSQADEETLIRAFFRDRKGGFFLDVGSSHYEKDSTTYYLEKHLGWRGIAVDALEEFRVGYERFRPRTRFFAFFVTNEAAMPRDFHVYTRDTRISSGSLEHLRGLPGVKERHIETVTVPTATLDRLLASEAVDRVDFVSLDIEGSEPEALEGFDIDRYRPELLCVEIQTYTRGRVFAYFASHGYQPIEPYRNHDEVNTYFRRP
jgi:FkbM family methyltransferase